MKIVANKKNGFRALDIIVEAWLAKTFPYDSENAVVPQRLIPPELVADKEALALFLFGVCQYMKGRIKSEDAFVKLLIMHKERPDFMRRNSDGFVNALQKTCLSCQFFPDCKFTIPAAPYYQNIEGENGERLGGFIYFIERPPIELKWAKSSYGAESDSEAQAQFKIG